MRGGLCIDVAVSNQREATRRCRALCIVIDWRPPQGTQADDTLRRLILGHRTWLDNRVATACHATHLARVWRASPCLARGMILAGPREYYCTAPLNKALKNRARGRTRTI